MGKYGNIDGIVTLTGDFIARDNAKGTIGRILSSREKESKERKTVRMKTDSSKSKKIGADENTT